MEIKNFLITVSCSKANNTYCFYEQLKSTESYEVRSHDILIEKFKVLEYWFERICPWYDLKTFSKQVSLTMEQICRFMEEIISQEIEKINKYSTRGMYFNLTIEEIKLEDENAPNQ